MVLRYGKYWNYCFNFHRGYILPLFTPEDNQAYATRNRKATHNRWQRISLHYLNPIVLGI